LSPKLAGVNILVYTSYGSSLGITRSGAFMKKGNPLPAQEIWTLLATLASL